MSKAAVLLSSIGMFLAFARPQNETDPVAAYACAAVWVMSVERWLFPKIDAWRARRDAKRRGAESTQTSR
jgi:hypothetical protein